MRLPNDLLLVGLLALATGCRGNATPAPTEEATENQMLRAEVERLHADVERLTSKADRSAAELREKSAWIEQIKRRLGSSVISGGPTNMASVDGLVTRVVEEFNFVGITIGKDAELAIGETMTVYRGNEYIGKLVIDKKGDDWASGHMDLKLTKTFPKKGDSASTRL
jgi:hypothetical protein